MFVFSSLGGKGNLGNQLFQIASTVGLANRHGREFSFPEWGYSKYFNFELPQQNKNIKLVQIVEKCYGYHEWEIGNEDYDINGALQSEKYFDVTFTKKLFEFKTDFLKKLLDQHQYLFTRKTIFISIRRGDFVYHPHYYQLPYRYYFLALKEHFPDWKKRNIIFMSDDISYCKFHFCFLKNAFFLENISPIEQLAVSSQGHDFIISNSTFSWWVAWLAEKEESKIIRPLKNFRGSFEKLNDDSDFFPERWIKFDYRKKKIGLEYFNLIIKGTCFQIINIVQFRISNGIVLTKKVINKIFHK